MSGGQVIEIRSFSNIPEVVPSNFVNWRKYHLNLGYSAEQDLQHHLSLSLTGGLLQMMPKGEGSIIYTVIHKCVPYPILFLSPQNKSVVVWNIQKPQMLQRFGLTGSIFDGYVKGIESVPNSQTVWVLDY